MITSLWVNNFKSLVDFRIELAKFNCFVGLNGSGKSTLLQALDFVSQLMECDVQAWLRDRHWERADLNSKLTKKSNIEFCVGLDISGQQVVWSASFNRSSLRCTKEAITENGKKVFSVEDGVYVVDGRRHDIVFDYQGSVLSRLKDKHQNRTARVAKTLIRSITSLNVISPDSLRHEKKFPECKIERDGERSLAFLNDSGADAQFKLKQALQTVYPQLTSVATSSLHSSWKQLVVRERFDDRNMISTASHVNDGMLRLLAIMIQLEMGGSFLLFDEIENGIDPEIIEFLVDHLVDSRNQVLVTTHSPMILNSMKDDVARDGVHYLYKTNSGFTRSVRFFDIPSMAKKLEFMGPGEAFIDTDLLKLHQEITNNESLAA